MEVPQEILRHLSPDQEAKYLGKYEGNDVFDILNKKASDEDCSGMPYVYLWDGEHEKFVPEPLEIYTFFGLL